MARMKTQNLNCDIACAITGETDNTQSRTPGRCGNGNDGVSDLQLAVLGFSMGGARLVWAADHLAFYLEALRGPAEERLAAAGGSVPAAAYLTAKPQPAGMVRCQRFRCGCR